MMRISALVLVLAAGGPAQALDLVTFRCDVATFVDDSRYPLDEASIALNQAMKVDIIDAGRHLVVETTMPGEETLSTQLPTIDRSPDRIVAAAKDDASEHSVMLERSGDTITGLRVYLTYEVDQRWTLTCRV